MCSPGVCAARFPSGLQRGRDGQHSPAKQSRFPVLTRSAGHGSHGHDTELIKPTGQGVLPHTFCNSKEQKTGLSIQTSKPCD